MKEEAFTARYPFIADEPDATFPDADHNDLANAIRLLTMDAVEMAGSGHPGMPLGMADVATVLFSRFLKFDPQVPGWPDRDRFVLSAGHGSMLLYSLLYLTGYKDVTIDDLKSFRQLGSRTPGHPEYGTLPGVEATTGPLGQGMASAVGMAIAERMMNARLGDDLVDHFTYVIAGDGCLMEGLSQEAIELAGHLRLSKLIVLFDDNKVSIDGPTRMSTSTDHLARFAACGWWVRAVDGHDPTEIRQAIGEARRTDRPSLIACRTQIGRGAPTMAGGNHVHGTPLGAEEIARARKAMGWETAPFTVPAPVLTAWRDFGRRSGTKREEWDRRYANAGPAQRRLLRRAPPLGDEARDALVSVKLALAKERPEVPTLQSSRKVLDAIMPVMPELMGGAADLAGLTGARALGQKAIKPGKFDGSYVHYGIREHVMAGVMNGISLHGGFVPYGSTFLAFSDYCRAAIRLSAMMGLNVVYVMTHDSIGVGEDGPTHQPIEHLASFRAMPNINVFRPADAVETSEVWQSALEQEGVPSLICLSRQALPTLRTSVSAENMAARGAYLIAGATADRDVTLLASGSEVAIAVEAAGMLEEEGVKAAVVSMPCFELFRQQGPEYRRRVLGTKPKVAIEAAVRDPWDRFLGEDDVFIGLDEFGASGSAEDLYDCYGLTAEAVFAAALRLVR
ncbi:transketolase [Hartmannibacter diazotrophicus]|uniref:transketolase n=1 Tax=Hartmannibacter diazotrophicus TaxID=1482074 RepID=UPI003CCBACB0